ncbi:uncharacterized protein CEXT_780421 [Caerostris extrusa]|uniref:Uncharacterized protein n=1 Tax=Caerostris extrusa TaxID=172846 RepID=A0AAV4P4L4_CAEEX|nr:uncharacterized protein CEXT_780421 [Caerostris extrusa]
MPKDSTDNNGRLRCDACDYQKLKKLENNPDVRELRDKIEQMNIRLSECRTENQMLKRSLYLAKQMVYKEVGETSGDFKTLLKHGEESGFRVERKTRTENVLVLRKKVQDLQDYLKKLEGQEPDRCKAKKTPSEEFVKKRIPEERKAYWRMELERRLARENAEKEITPIVKECSELRKKVATEKAQFRDLSNELNLLRAEYQSQVLKSEEDMGLVQSFETLQTQLQDTLKDRAEIREELAGYRERNRRLEGEISTTKEELQMLYNKAKDNNILIDSLTSKHKQIQEAIEAEKSIVRQNVDRYKNELLDMRENYEEDLKLLDTLQKITYERNSFIDKLNEDIIEGIEIVVEEPEVIEKPPEIVPVEESKPRLLKHPKR